MNNKVKFRDFFKNQIKICLPPLIIGIVIISFGIMTYASMEKRGDFSCESAEGICGIGAIFPMFFILVGGICIICVLLIILVDFIIYLSNQKQ